MIWGRTERRQALGAIMAIVLLVACGRGGEEAARPVAADVDVPEPAVAAAREVEVAAVGGPEDDAARPAEPSVASTRRARETHAEIVTIVIGDFDEDLRGAVEAGLEASLPVDVRRGEAWALPKAAYYPPRRRYRADTLIDLLSEAAVDDASPGVRYLGLTSVDVSTTKGKHRDWGIFGLAFCPGRGAVISSHRLRKGARDREHFAFRVTNTAIHEVGHSLGLDHCDEPRCPMQDAEGSIETTDSSEQVLGPGCAAKLAELLEDAAE
jgi:archaemetzincin